MWAGESQRCGRREPLLCDDLGELETCLGVEDAGARAAGRIPSSLLSRTALYNGSGRLQRAASTCMQLAQEKMLVLSGARKKQDAVESSHTFAEAERQVGSAEWCGLQCTGADRTPTQLAALNWAARNRSLAERSESASVTSAAETVRGLREPEREREPAGHHFHEVTAFDNISGITVKYDITVEELLAVNKPATRASLLARKSIRIPVFAEEADDDKMAATNPHLLNPALVKASFVCGDCVEDVVGDVRASQVNQDVRTESPTHAASSQLCRPARPQCVGETPDQSPNNAHFRLPSF